MLSRKASHSLAVCVVACSDEGEGTGEGGEEQTTSGDQLGEGEGGDAGGGGGEEAPPPQEEAESQGGGAAGGAGGDEGDDQKPPPSGAGDAADEAAQPEGEDQEQEEEKEEQKGGQVSRVSRSLELVTVRKARGSDRHPKSVRSCISRVFCLVLLSWVLGLEVLFYCLLYVPD